MPQMRCETFFSDRPPPPPPPLIAHGAPISLIAVPATLVGWHFTTAFNRHTDRERKRARMLREQSRARCFTADSAARIGLPAAAEPAAPYAAASGSPASAAAAAAGQREAIKAAVEEATATLRLELRELKTLILQRAVS